MLSLIKCATLVAYGVIAALEMRRLFLVRVGVHVPDLGVFSLLFVAWHARVVLDVFVDLALLVLADHQTRHVRRRPTFVARIWCLDFILCWLSGGSFFATDLELARFGIFCDLLDRRFGFRKLGNRREDGVFNDDTASLLQPTDAVLDQNCVCVKALGLGHVYGDDCTDIDRQNFDLRGVDVESRCLEMIREVLREFFLELFASVLVPIKCRDITLQFKLGLVRCRGSGRLLAVLANVDDAIIPRFGSFGQRTCGTFAVRLDCAVFRQIKPVVTISRACLALSTAGSIRESLALCAVLADFVVLVRARQESPADRAGHILCTRNATFLIEA